MENNGNIASFAGLSGFLKGEKGAKLAIKKNTLAKFKKARAERLKTASKPQQVRVRKAVKIANRLLAGYREGGINISTGKLNNNTENAVEELANGNARLITLAKQRAKEIDPDFMQNNAAAEEFRNALVNNVFRLNNNGAAGLFSQQ
jgi:DNA transposition AAA+ family ATPase